MRESNSHQRFWRPLSYHLTNPLWLPLTTFKYYHKKASLSNCNYFVYKPSYCQVIVGKYFIQINYRTASVRYAAKTRCVSYLLHSLIHSGSCANSPCGLRHAPAFVAKAQLPTEASLSSFASYHHPSQFSIRTSLWNEVFSCELSSCFTDQIKNFFLNFLESYAIFVCR